jgi:hypothetical protein
MAIISRQTGLVSAENWKKIYQTFREADFTTYDFETLRKSMIDYIKLYYPEDFNDFTESSEFIALIDLIAFLGQSLAFRTDLNARENFLDTAERRDSVLKLAKLISYNPKRSIPATGYLKIDSVNTTENIFDSDGFNLSNIIVNWTDPSNDNWQEQFTAILNAAIVNTQVVGRPSNTQELNGVTTDEYGLNLVPDIIPVYRYDSSVEGTRTTFELVSASSLGKDYLYEVAPDFNRPFNFLYRNDFNGNTSNNTGYFFYFKQGNLSSLDFSIAEAVPNKVVDVDIDNINNNDLWLYSLNSDGTTDSLWTKVPATSGINIIYNNTQDRNLYQVNTRAGDRISLVFGDGSFTNIPQGNYRLYYRTGNGLNYRITPDEMRSITISFNYLSRLNRIETITFRASLKYTVANASARESTEQIKQKAPQQYYTQNRMITGEDYNILPYTTFSQVVKAKAINRTSSGLSRYLDMIDTTGKYSSTNIFGQDGVLYENRYTKSFTFSFRSQNDIQNIIYDRVINDLIASKEMMHLYYSSATPLTLPGTNLSAGQFIIGRRYIISSVGTTDFTAIGGSRNVVGANFVATSAGTDTGFGDGEAYDATVEWNQSTAGNNSSTGYFKRFGNPFRIAVTVGGNGKYLRNGATIKFVAPDGYYFNGSNILVVGTPAGPDDRLEIYSSIIGVVDDGTNQGLGNFTNGQGPVTLNDKIPTGAIVHSIIPVYKNNFSTGFTTTLVNLVKTYKNFGIAYSDSLQSWRLIRDINLDTDTEWLVKFEYNGNNDQYLVSHRGIEYVFHSPLETTFYFDKSLKVYDSKTGKTIQDHINILKTNSKPDENVPLGKNKVWAVHKPLIDVDGYSDNTRIYLTYADSDNDGVPDDPQLFEQIVNPALNSNSKLIFFETVTGVGFNRYIDSSLVPSGQIISEYATRNAILEDLDIYQIGQVFYTTTDKIFYSVIQLNSMNKGLSPALTRYAAFVGRRDIYFQYRHNSPNTRRVDPSISNIIDVYVLTNNYDTAYRRWIYDVSSVVAKPDEPTNAELSVEFGELNNLKTISDTVVFQPAIYKPIFGDKSASNLQAIFKVVKNPNLNISDADIKTSVISAINEYFDISNWDFGETFYFSELAAYLHRALTPNIASIIIVPKDSSIRFGTLQQINAEPNEIIISAATVNDIEVIAAVTASQLNQGIVEVN